MQFYPRTASGKPRIGQAATIIFRIGFRALKEEFGGQVEPFIREEATFEEVRADHLTVIPGRVVFPRRGGKSGRR
jgi:hypothetical protein